MNEADSEARPLRFDSPDAIDARVGDGSSFILQVDKGLGKQFISTLFWCAMICGAAVIGLIATCFFIYATIGHVAVLQYDLFDLRAKMGLAHENTPPPPPPPENSN